MGGGGRVISVKQRGCVADVPPLGGRGQTKGFETSQLICSFLAEINRNAGGNLGMSGGAAARRSRFVHLETRFIADCVSSVWLCHVTE